MAPVFGVICFLPGQGTRSESGFIYKFQVRLANIWNNAATRGVVEVGLKIFNPTSTTLRNHFVMPILNPAYPTSRKKKTSLKVHC
jgi:hypothetical protein